MELLTWNLVKINCDSVLFSNTFIFPSSTIYFYSDLCFPGSQFFGLIIIISLKTCHFFVFDFHLSTDNVITFISRPSHWSFNFIFTRLTLCFHIQNKLLNILFQSKHVHILTLLPSQDMYLFPIPQFSFKKLLFFWLLRLDSRPFPVCFIILLHLTCQSILPYLSLNNLKISTSSALLVSLF